MGKQARPRRKGGLTVNRSFDAATGRASTITAFDALNTTLQDLTLTFDLVGNLTQKIDQNRTLSGTTKNLDESFSYDALNRLTSVAKNGSTSLSLTYDALGNITNKSDVGSYSYATRPHAVTSAGGVSYGYDLNGSMISGDGRTLSYTAFNKPDYLAKGSSHITIAYGPNRNRYQRIDSVSGSVTTTHYVGNVEKIFKPNGVVETKRYLDGELIVTSVTGGAQNGTTEERYLLKDHLGSTDLITDENAQIVQAMSFDAFGQRRSEIDYTALTTGQIMSFNTNITRKGFTGHEGLDPVGLIHMNGRVYDPKLGRFVSADPFVQAPRNTQSFNRYSYTINNPLSYTDPSGYNFKRKFICGVIAAVSFAACHGEMKCTLVLSSVLDSVYQSVFTGSGGGGAAPPGSVPAVFGNGSQTPTSYPTSSCRWENGCILNVTGEATPDIIITGTIGETSSDETGGKFENGGGSDSFIRGTVGPIVFPTITSLGIRGKPGTFQDNVIGAFKQNYNTAVPFLTTIFPQAGLLANLTGLPTQLAIKDEELLGASIAEAMTVIVSLGIGLESRAVAVVPRAAGDAFAGIKEASQVLQSAGFPRSVRVQILQSFEAGTVSVGKAGANQFGLRFFDGRKARALGGFLFDTFPASRQSLALRPEFNAMTGLRQFQIRPGATVISGRATSQGVGFEGGQIQRYIFDPSRDLLP